MITRMLALAFYAVVATAANAASPYSRSSVERFDVTFVSQLPDGELRRETRPLRPDEVRALGVFGGDDVVSAKGVDDGAPPRPNPPMNGSVPDDLLRIDYHRELNGWTRDTSYGRTHGGPWQLLNDSLRRTGGGPNNGSGGDCPPGSGPNCIDLN